jgi:hypothetical protein
MNEVTIYCPPSGTPIENNCSDTQNLSWTQDEVSYIQYFVSTVNQQLVEINISGITNSTTDVLLDIVYYRDNIYGSYQTWDLGVITTGVNLYHYLDFGNSVSVNNYITLQFTLTGGTGDFDVTFNCSPSVVSEEFCTGSTFNDACECSDFTTLYARSDNPKVFPVYDTTWYIDSLLQNEAPCANYVRKEGARYVNYYYNCATSTPEIYGFCTDVCNQIDCSGTSVYNHSATTFNYSNPLIEKSASPRNVYPFKNDYVNFPYLKRFSIHCITIIFPQGSNGIFPVKIDYNGPNIKEKYITFEDAAYQRTDDSPGVVSYSTLAPNDSPFFIPQANRGLYKFIGPSEIFYIIPPKSGLVTVKFSVGENSKNPFTPPEGISTTISASCTNTPIYKYTAGLHVYSAYDSIINPRLTTKVYSITPLASWQKNQTIIFNDNYFIQPAFPYWYSVSGNTYKVGYPFKRDFGTITQYKVKKKWFARAVNVEKISSPYQDQKILDVTTGFRTVPTCVNMLGTLGYIRDKVAENLVIQPNKYKYFLGLSEPGESGTNFAVLDKFLSNDNYFNLLNVEKAISNNNCLIVTGLEYALIKFGQAYATLIPDYLDSLTEARTKYSGLETVIRQQTINKSNLIFGVAAAVAFILVTGYWDYRSGGSVIGAFPSGDGGGRAARQAFTDSENQQVECPVIVEGGDYERPKYGGTPPLQVVIGLLKNTKLVLILIVVVVVAGVIQWIVNINKTVEECCKLLKVVNGLNPYLLSGDTIYMNQSLVTPFTNEIGRAHV